MQILPVVTSLEVASVSSDGSSATVQIYGYGFVEGANSEYRLGSETLTDAGINTGPYVDSVYDSSISQYVNGRATMTVPLSDGVFGPITVKTAGGTSAAYSVSLASITATALSGTPANAGQASANAGQAITLNGSGLSTSTDVLLRWTNVNGDPQMTRLSPSAVEVDGSSATLVIPDYANGAFALQVFGSSTQPLLQIVPTLTRYDQQDRIVLFGSGYVESASTYAFTGVSVTDTPALGNNIDVYYDGEQNRSAYLNRTALPIHGLGNVTVTTAGGTSAPFALNLLQVNNSGDVALGDVAVNPSTGALWILDYTNPNHILRIDPATGSVLQTITYTGDYGLTYSYNHAGLQVLGAAMSLNGVAIPTGSLLVFNGYVNPDRVIAVDPSTGSVLATRILDGNHDLAAGLYDAATDYLFVLKANNSLLEVNPATGATLATITLPISIGSHAGIALDPVSGNLWIGGTNSTEIVEITKAGVEVRRVNLSTQGVNQGEISGLAFNTDGTLMVASTQGVVYQATV